MSSRAAALEDAFGRLTLEKILGGLVALAIAARCLVLLLSPPCDCYGPWLNINPGYCCHYSSVKAAKISAQDLQSIADGWREDHPNECPTPRRLKDEKQMSAGSSLNDPWGSPWKIVCSGLDTTVISFGPDEKEGTADDIFFPPIEEAQN